MSVVGSGSLPLGKTYKTPAGGILTIVGDNKLLSNRKKYKLECSICSKDAEMFPVPFEAAKESLEAGSIPCHCGRKKVYSEQQYKLKIERSLNKTYVVGRFLVDYVMRGKKGWVATVSCSICSRDKGLWPSGSITVNETGKLNCSCGGNTRYTKEQFELLINRECSKRGIYFKGWVNKFQGAKSKLHLINPITGEEWESFGYSSLVKKQHSPLERPDYLSSLLQKDEQYHLDNFKSTGKYTESHSFRRLDGLGGLWEMTCECCSNDAFAKAGLCSGKFTLRATQFALGRLPCRCNKHYVYSEDQRKFQILNRLKLLRGQWIGWVEDYKNCDTHFNWVCNEGHLCKTSIDKFLNSEQGCATCVKEEPSFNGYYPDRVGKKDYLYVFGLTTTLKVGRSFNIDERSSGIKSLAKLKEKPATLLSYTAPHQVIYKTEQAILKQLRKQGYQYACKWTNESFYSCCWGTLQDLLAYYVDKGDITVA